MSKSWLYGVLGFAIAAGLTASAYILGRASVVTEETQAAEEIDELRGKAADAAVVRRVSKQMEDIAYQQKEVSDRQRKRAEQQTEIAQAMRSKAEQESRSARAAERRAKEAAAEAEFERENALRNQQEAEAQRDAANYAKSLADTLTGITLGRALGNASTDKFESGYSDLASRLAYSGWYLMRQYGGNVYQNEIFIPLCLCSGSERRWYTDKSGAVTSLCTIGGGCAVVTDYGEVEYIESVSGAKRILFQDNKYDFRDVVTDGSSIIALSLHGPLFIIGFDSSVRSIELPSGTYRGIERCENGLLTVSSDRSLIVMEINSGKVLKNIPLPKVISSAVNYGDSLYLFFTDGTATVTNQNFDIHPAAFSTEIAVTAAYPDIQSGVIYLGLDNGEIKVLHTSDNSLTDTISSHSSRITSILKLGRVLMSTAFDKSVEMADLSSVFNFASASLSLRNWPLCSCILDEKHIMTGTSDGMILLFDSSADSMAAKIRQSGSGPLSREEWLHYAGTNIPYPDFR